MDSSLMCALTWTEADLALECKGIIAEFGWALVSGFPDSADDKYLLRFANAIGDVRPHYARAMTKPAAPSRERSKVYTIRVAHDRRAGDTQFHYLMSLLPAIQTSTSWIILLR